MLTKAESLRPQVSRFKEVIERLEKAKSSPELQEYKKLWDERKSLLKAPIELEKIQSELDILGKLKNREETLSSIDELKSLLEKEKENFRSAREASREA